MPGELRGKWEEWRAEWCWIVEDQPQAFTAPRTTPIARGRDWSELDSDDVKLDIALVRILRLRLARLSVAEVGADFLRRRIAPLQDRKRPAWLYGGPADIMRLRPGLNFNFTTLELRGMVRELFKYDPAHPEWFRTPREVVPLCNNAARDRILAMMPMCDSHGLDRSWIPPKPIDVLTFYDNLVEVASNKEDLKLHTRDTTEQEIAYIASRAEEAAAAAAAGVFGFSPEEAEAEEASTQAEEAEIRRLLNLPPDALAGVPSLRHSGISGIATEAAAMEGTAGGSRGAARGGGAKGKGAAAQDAGPSEPAGEEEEEEEAEDSGGSTELYADDLSSSESSPPPASPRQSPAKRLRKAATGERAQAGQLPGGAKPHQGRPAHRPQRRRPVRGPRRRRPAGRQRAGRGLLGAEQRLRPPLGRRQIGRAHV